MKLAIVLPYLEKISPGQEELARNIKLLGRRDIRGIFCGPDEKKVQEFGDAYFDFMADPKQGLDGVIYKGLTSIHAEYIWFFGDDYLHAHALKTLFDHLDHQTKTLPILLETHSVENAHKLEEMRKKPLVHSCQTLTGDAAFMQFKDELGYISRVIYVTKVLDGHFDLLSQFMKTNWVCLAAIFMTLMPKNNPSQVQFLNGIKVFGLDRDQTEDHWYDYKTFLYHTLEVISVLKDANFSIKRKNINAVSRNIMWRALKARAVHKLESITHGYANNWDLKRLKILLSSKNYCFVCFCYHLDFVLVLAARILRWKQRYL